MPENVKEIYFHEDDYCQQELLPLAATEFCRQQITQIDEFSAAHTAPDGLGWTGIFLRDDSPNTLSDLGIRRESLREALSKRLPEVPVIYSGYSSHRELCKRTIGFGFHSECVIYADWNENGVVGHIWTGLFTPHATELDAAVDALQHLGQRFPLLYVDWAWSFATPLDQSPALHDRLESKIEEIKRRMGTQGLTKRWRTTVISAAPSVSGPCHGSCYQAQQQVAILRCRQLPRQNPRLIERLSHRASPLTFVVQEDEDTTSGRKRRHESPLRSHVQKCDSVWTAKRR